MNSDDVNNMWAALSYTLETECMCVVCRVSSDASTQNIISSSLFELDKPNCRIESVLFLSTSTPAKSPKDTEQHQWYLVEGGKHMGTLHMQASSHNLTYSQRHGSFFENS